MRVRGWLVGMMLVSPALARAQAVKAADLVGGWRIDMKPGHDDGKTHKTRGWLVLWPDNLWWFAAPLSGGEHGGARWRLVGDTLWLANDYEPYMFSMWDPRIQAIRAKGHRDFATMDREVMEIIKQRKPYPVPDSIYWSKTFRDSVSACVVEGRPCDTWVYKVSKRGQQLFLTLLDSLSIGPDKSARTAVLQRDSVVTCRIHGSCSQ